MMKTNKLGLVLDTNVLLVSISSKSRFHWIFELFETNTCDLFLSNEVLTEYEEKILHFLDQNALDILDRFIEEQMNVVHIDPYFKFNLISADPDDNKFVDLAIASNADYIITNDKHFNILAEVSFPKVNCVSVQEFHEIAKEIGLL